MNRQAALCFIVLGGLLAATAGTQTAAQEAKAADPTVVKAEHFAVTPPLRDLPPIAVNHQPCGQNEAEEPHRVPKADYGKGKPWQDGALVSPRPEAMPEAMPSATTFAGQGNTTCGCEPPDPNGDVGPNHYVQVVNTGYAVYNKSGTLLTSGTLQSLWSSMTGSQCASTDDGDPIVLYDRAADRWIISQFSLSPANHQCIACSKTSDPTGQWYTWDFLWSATIMNDYPHFGVWPDGYYMACNQFNGNNWAGAGAACFERAAMLTGSSGARMVKFDIGSGSSTHNLDYGGQLPSDLEGATAPPAGMPNLFAEADDQNFPGDTQAHIRLWKFHVDWTNTGNSTFGNSGPAGTMDPNFVIPCTNFTYMPNCGTSSDPNSYCVPQKGTSTKIDDLGDRIMHRTAYHNFGTYESLTLNLTVDAGSGRAGIRWWELRNASTTPAIYQEATYAPSDSLYRWMASMAMNKAGDLAIAYSSSSSSTYPNLAYSGRFAGDPLNNLSQGEATMYAGASYFSGNRWGDYTCLKTDPSDDCTFWFTDEYGTSSHAWTTRVGHFKVVPLAPAAPTFSSVASTSMTVNWTTTGGAATYDVYRASGSSCTGAVKINASPVSGTTYSDSGLTPSSPYSYYVVATDACGATNGSCATQSTSAASTPLRVPYSVTPDKITTTTQGTNLTFTWDKTNCPSTNYHIIYGLGANIATLATSSPTVAGSACSIGTSGTYTWSSAPSPAAGAFLWFLVVGDNGSTTEGSWGLTSGSAEEGGTAASGQCSCAAKNTSGTCGTP